MNVEGYENYVVFEDGVVINVLTGRQMKTYVNRGGYLRLDLNKSSKKGKFLVSRLVAIAYIENPENKPQVDHINRVRTDNRVENLTWATHLENCQNKGVQKNNKLGEVNISKTKNGRYKFQKCINKITHYKCFKTLEEAVIYRDNYLSNL